MSNDWPLLSVAIPNYNSARYLRECLDSVLSQTYPNLEIVIDDDCSNDASLEILRDYEANHCGKIRVFFSAKNRGVEPTRNHLIAQAQGQYLTLLDNDDYYDDPHKLENEMNLVRRHEAETGRTVVAFSNIVLVSEDGRYIGPQCPAETIREGMIFDESLTRSCMIPRDFVARRTAYLECGEFRSKFKAYGDWDFQLRLAARYSFHFTAADGTAYRQHEDSLGSRLSAMQKANEMWAIFCDNLPISDAVRRESLIARFAGYMVQWAADTDARAAQLRLACDERLRLVEELHRVAEERLELAANADARAAQLEIACDERLRLIEELSRIAQERLELIDRLDAELKKREAKDL